jgi:hypothetical protein
MTSIVSGPLDWLIILFGLGLIAAHFYGIWGHYHTDKFVFLQELDLYRSFCLLLTELLPMLGLFGTVMGLMQTFRSFGGVEDGQPPDLSVMVQSFAPAMTSTILGLLMAIPNLVLNAVLFLLCPMHHSDKDH